MKISAQLYARSRTSRNALQGRTDHQGRFVLSKIAFIGSLLATTSIATHTWAAAPQSDQAGGDQASSGPASSVQGASGGQTNSNQLSEIVVTAEKRSSTIQNTPISLSAISGRDLVAEGITTVEEVAREVPGLSTRSAGPGQTEYEARGIASNGGSSPTVGFYLDEVPLSPPAMGQVGKVEIDPDLYDLNRVEVLRGPQGTLYGSGSEGGTIKVITNLPKLDTFEGGVQATGSGTEGGGANGGGKFFVNIPIDNALAVRVVGTDTYRSGWIDRIVLNPFPEDVGTTRANVLAAPVQSDTKDVNTEHLYGVRGSLLFQPNSDFSVVAGVFYQHLGLGGYDEFDSPPGGDYHAHYAAADIPEPLTDAIQIYSLTATANLGFADLTSATSYFTRQENQTQEASESISSTLGIYPYVAVGYSEDDSSRQFSQEIRLTSRGNGPLHWVTGAFYSDLNSLLEQYGANQSTFSGPDNPAGIIAAAHNPYQISQVALFADGSYNITDTLKLSFGMRVFNYFSQEHQQEYGAVLPSATPPPPTRTAASATGYTPRIDLSYSPTSSLTTYISATKGFRPGGANNYIPPPSIAPFCPAGSPTSFDPDTVWDYEIGEKAKLFDKRLSINGDFYYINWDGIQQTAVLPCGAQYIANAGNARSFGPELEISAKLSSHWSFTASGTYTDAEITQPASNFVSVVAGSVSSCPTISNCSSVPVLNVPKETASAALTYTTAFANDYRLTARVSDSYVGSSYDEAFYFGIPLRPYNIANARVGLSNGKWTASLFVNNFTNTVAEITANNTSFEFNIPGLIRYSTNQPRTIGTQLDYNF